VAGLARYAIYVFDYGAPVGFRLATHHPERITAIISQNGNAYQEGLSGGWNPIQRYWKEPTVENRAALRNFLTPEATKWQYVHGVQDESLVAPESYTLDSALLARPGNNEIQLDLFLDYASNVALYPKFQEYFRTHRPPLLAVWGKNDPFFLPSGAEAFKRDIPGAVVRFFDTGHFALETHAAEITPAIRDLAHPELHRSPGEPALRAIERGGANGTPAVVRPVAGRVCPRPRRRAGDRGPLGSRGRPPTHRGRAVGACAGRDQIACHQGIRPPG